MRRSDPVAIGVKETQEIIRQAAVVSRSEPALPCKLDPQEVAMATGPRYRKRALMRPGQIPDYLRPSEASIDEWQKLDDDIYKFIQIRKDQFGRLATPPSHQFIAEMEAHLKFADPAYELGSYLGLMRQAADLDQTRQTFVTASEKSTFHAFARRLTEGRREGEAFDPEMIKRYRDLLDSNQATTFRGLADLFRLVSRAAKLPLLGNMNEAPSLSLTVLLNVVDLAARFNQLTQGKLEFQVGPMDVFLGARTVLFNRSVAHPTLAMVKELVLDDSGLYHDDLLEWLESVGVFGSELTMLMPESLTENGFSLQGANYSAMELVMAAGAKLAKGQGPIDKALNTLADAIVHKIQQQDGHKDKQIQNILAHFNRLIQGERRSAARVTEDRQQAKFDYMTAIQRASQLARTMQTGQFQAMVEGEASASPVVSVPGKTPVKKSAGSVADLFTAKLRISEDTGNVNVKGDSSETEMVKAVAIESVRLADAEEAKPEARMSPTPAAAVVAGISSMEYERLLGVWDDLLGRLRKRLSAKSPVFKSLASQLAKVRSLDTCLAYGVTPGGGRCTSRLAKLICGEEVRAKLSLEPELAAAMEEAFTMDYPAFLGSMESLIATVYEFRPGMLNLQFRLRDRRPATPWSSSEPRHPGKGDGRETVVWSEGSELDEPMLRLLIGAILLGRDAQAQSVAPQFQVNGNIREPDEEGLASIGLGDPFLAYCAFLWVGKQTLGQAPIGDLDTSLMLMIRLTPEWRRALLVKYRELFEEAQRPTGRLPKVSEMRVRDGWERGFERGFMAEVRAVYEETDGGPAFDGRLLELLTQIQPDIDKACESVEAEKLRLTRERVSRILD